MSQNKSLDLSPISIEWSLQSPGLTPKSWRVFDSEENPANAARQGVEANLDLPAGTLTALDFAFQKRLPRSLGWDLSKLAQHDALLAASKIFRRGVVTNLTPPQSQTGSYRLSFSQNENPLDDLPQDGPRILDKNVQKLWAIKPRPEDLVLELNELTKTLDSVATIAAHIQKFPGPVTILGGGILADTAAFAAALKDRSFRLVPTTLLAMVDACVGGKTGVNFGQHGKNQLGLFAFPLDVLVNAHWLSTLPEREIKAGLAESYKHALITGDELFAAEIAGLPPKAPAIIPYLRRLIAVKAEIIAEDPNEAGKRAILNFGHTLAHALEKISQEHHPEDPLLHGEAIAIGLRFAAFLSYQTGRLAKNIHDRLQTQLRQALFMPTKDEFEKHLGTRENLFEKLLEGIRQDKKNATDTETTEWVLIEDFGRFAQTGPLYTVPVAISDIKKSWETFITQEGFFRS